MPPSLRKRLPSGRTCRKCGVKYVPKPYDVGQECPTCRAAIDNPLCKTCGKPFKRHKSKPRQMNCSVCAAKKKRKCRTCRVILTYEIESDKKGYCRKCRPPDAFCCVCGKKINKGFRCKECQRFMRKADNMGKQRADFNPSSVDGFFLTDEEVLYRRQLKLARLKQVWQARGYT